MTGPVGNFFSSSISALVSVFTAVTTVYLAFWFRNKKDKINALRAVRTEIVQNDIHAEMVLHDLFQMRDGFEYNDDGRTTIPFQTSGFEHLKNTGILAGLPQIAKESIHYHYTLIKTLNRRLEQREDVRLHVSSLQRPGTITSIDNTIFNHLIDVSDPARLEAMSANLRENSKLVEKLANAAESTPDETQQSEQYPRQSFDGVIDFINQEIERDNIFGLF